MSEIAIRVEGLSKQYHIGQKQERYRTLRDTLADAALAPFRRLRSALRHSGVVSGNGDTIWALRDVSFEVRLGEVISIASKISSGSRGFFAWRQSDMCGLMLRQRVRGILPVALSEAPKRPVQTPQREWLRGPLRAWADECIDAALDGHGGEWLDVRAVRAAREYGEGPGDSSFYVWQWINLVLRTEVGATTGDANG